LKEGINSPRGYTQKELLLICGKDFNERTIRKHLKRLVSDGDIYKESIIIPVYYLKKK